jgi:hypothetical protein
VKPIQQFLSLAKEMVVALVDKEASMMRCTSMGVIEECSVEGIWIGFLIPHTFFVIVKVKIVNSNYKNHTAHCELSFLSILGQVVEHWIL